MEQEVDTPSQFPFSLFSASLSVIVLVSVLPMSRAQATRLLPDRSNPSQSIPFPSLTEMSSSSTPSAAPKTWIYSAAPVQDIPEEEILNNLSHNGFGTKSYRKPSTRFMVHLFNKLQRGDHSTGQSSRVTDTIRSFSGQNLKATKTGKPVVDLYIPHLPRHERLKCAEIRFLRNRIGRATDRSGRYKFNIDVVKSDQIVKKVSLHQKILVQHEYDVLDVTKTVRQWINGYSGNISLHVKVSKKFKTHAFVTSNGKSSQLTTLIVLYLEDGEFLKTLYSRFASSVKVVVKETHNETFGGIARSMPEPFALVANSSITNMPILLQGLASRDRGKRDAKKRKKKNRKIQKWHKASKESCRLFDFEVDFNIIGWGQWIIHPKKFNSRFCLGACPSPIGAQYKPTNHAMLQTLMRLKRPRSAPGPCCVPIKLNPLSMLYFEYDEIVVRHHEDMIAEECGCR